MEGELVIPQPEQPYAINLFRIHDGVRMVLRYTLSIPWGTLISWT